MHIMIDCEALGFGERGTLLQLSAVAFELNGAVLDPHELLQYEDRWFNAHIHDPMGSVTPSAAQFWQAPEQAEALARITATPAVFLSDALTRFNVFVKQWLGKRGYIWAKPVHFDVPLLRGAYTRSHLEPAWHPKNELDLRTMLWLAKKMPRANFLVPDIADQGLTKHFALHDAVVQAICAQAAFNALTISATQRNRPACGKLVPVEWANDLLVGLQSIADEDILSSTSEFAETLIHDYSQKHIASRPRQDGGASG